MNAQDLLDYTLGQLEPARREQLERQAAADPELAQRLERLDRQVRLLLHDDPPEPPADLAERTIRFVFDRRRRRTFMDLVPVTVPFRWADVAVAATIFLAALVTLVPALQRGRSKMNQAACAFNLRELGTAFRQYSDTHGTLPYPPLKSKAPYAGAFAVLLHERGLVPDIRVLDCPGNGPSHMPNPLPDFDSVCAEECLAPRSSPCLRNLDYAYHLGYRNGSGIYPPPIRSDRLSATLALLADKPPHDAAGRILPGNSPNHGGSGQNVLFADGHAAQIPTRRISPDDDDMFLNQEHQPMPGWTPWDVVLAPGISRIDGK